MALSKNKIKQIHSLELKKFRTSTHTFIAEGFKCVGELLKEGFKAQTIIATPDWQAPLSKSCFPEYIDVTDDELRKASLLPHPQQVLGIFEIPDTHIDCNLNDIASEDLCLCLDGIQDPGNLGTIIRTADWFGVRHIVCSRDTVSCFNPKVVQSTMGSLFRVAVDYCDLRQWLSSCGKPIYGAVLDGDDIRKSEITPSAAIVIGNESRGISPELQPLLTNRLLIPNIGGSCESLNAAVATGIILSRFTL